MPSPFAWYREFVPCEALRADVYALFSFVPGPALAPASRSLLREVAFRKTIVCAPQFADGQVSIRFEVGQTCDVEGRWRADSSAFGETVIGPMSGVGRTDGLDFSETVGAYFRPGCASRFFDIPLSDLADTAVAVGDIWGTRGSPLSSQLADLNEAARIDRVESILLARTSAPTAANRVARRRGPGGERAPESRPSHGRRHGSRCRSVTPASLERVPRADRYRTEALQQACALSIGAGARERSSDDRLGSRRPRHGLR